MLLYNNGNCKGMEKRTGHIGEPANRIEGKLKVRSSIARIPYRYTGTQQYGASCHNRPLATLG
jgi:hypothetical protein